VATRHILCCLQCANKGPTSTPVLPLTEEYLEDSPLYALVSDDLQYTGQTIEERASELRTEWKGPGPWSLRFDLEVPKAYGGPRPTDMGKTGGITVSHLLTVIIRAEKGNTGGVQGRKGYDIILRYPIHLLSHLCNKVYTSLPQYSRQPSSGLPSIFPEVPATELHQFERLAAGQEAETGESPPSYKVSTPCVS